MTRAIIRLIKAIGYLLTGNLNKARDAISANPAAINARFDEVVRAKLDRFHDIEKIAAGFIVQQEKKIRSKADQAEKSERLERLIEGIKLTAQDRIAVLRQANPNITEAEIEADSEYKAALAKFEDYSTSFNEIQERIKELESDITGYDSKIKEHKLTMKTLRREIEKIKDEAKDTIADVLSAQTQKELADLEAGVARDTTGEELESLRDLRASAKAEARVASEMAGTDHKVDEDKLIARARSTKASTEFKSMLGLGVKTQAAPVEKIPEKLPE